MKHYSWQEGCSDTGYTTSGNNHRTVDKLTISCEYIGKRKFPLQKSSLDTPPIYRMGRRNFQYIETKVRRTYTVDLEPWWHTAEINFQSHVV